MAENVADKFSNDSYFPYTSSSPEKAQERVQQRNEAILNDQRDEQPREKESMYDFKTVEPKKENYHDRNSYKNQYNTIAAE